jgi:hypothetical protein
MNNRIQMAKIDSKSVTEVAAFLFLTAIFFMSCASTTQFGEDEDIHLQETKIFEDFTFGEIWEAVLRSVEEIDFIVQKRLVKNGFIFAQGKDDPDSLYPPPHMNIYIRQEYGKISVSCHVVIPGDRTNYEASSVYVDLFFRALHKKLPQLKTL